MSYLKALLTRISQSWLNEDLHLLPLRAAADLQSLSFTDGHFKSSRDPNMAQIFHTGVKGEALHAADLLPTEWRGKKNGSVEDITDYLYY